MLSPRPLATLCVVATISLLVAACGDADAPTPAPPTMNNGATSNASSPTSMIATCGAGTNPYAIAPPAAEDQIGDWRFELSGGTIRSIEGTAVSVRGVGTPAVIEQAVLLGTGGFLDPGCALTHNGTSYRWSGVACEDTPGTLFNVFLVPGEAYTLPEIEKDTRLRLSGYEIDKFKDYSAGGGYWQDGGDQGSQGQVSLWVTQICALD